LNNELAARDKGAAEARFLATQQFKESGDEFVTELVRANPYWSKLGKRRDQLEESINADMKRVAEMPSRDAIATLSESANTVLADRSYLREMEELLQRQWETVKSKDDKGRDVYRKGVARFPRIPGTETNVGDWKISEVNPNDP